MESVKSNYAKLLINSTINHVYPLAVHRHTLQPRVILSGKMPPWETSSTPEAPAMSRHAKPVRMQKNTTPQPQTSASGPKKPSSAPHCWAHSETASVSQNVFKKKNIYIYNIHIIQFFSTAAHFAFPKNLKASPVARKHVARPRWCDCSARILILWCPRFVIYSRTLTPNFPLRLLSAIIRMTRNFWNHHEKQHMSITKFFAFSHIKIEVSFLKCDLDMNQNMNVNVHLQT